MKYLCWSIFWFLLFSSVVASGPVLAVAEEGATDLESFLQKIELNSASINSFSCDFIQVRHLAIFPQPVKFSGRLTLSRPDRLRWEFITPLPSVLVLNGKKGLKCNDRGPVLEFDLALDPVMRVVAAQLWAWTSGSYRELQDDFDFELLPGPSLVFAPVQKGAASFIGKIKVVFDPEFLQPLEVEITEPGGDRTALFFSGYQRNIDLPATLFTECRPR
ncbi:MAG: outer membrane lipoprotein carrier protein LolA [Proteobacteria bacterium]|nr:outer membrane lipoprotein carrier protein LolA [Pseudomonadota bacterium]MBU1716728.1 outer membrane lipoprotein carrier protein LolA [Pseudomonadota bacterium]